jgi:hypothetical protein
MVKETIMNTVPERALITSYFLNEGLFEEQAGVTTKGADTIMVNKVADAGKMIERGALVKLSATPDYAVEKCANNDYLGVVVADPVGVPPTAVGMALREASVEHIEPGNKYHIKLTDANKQCAPGNFIVATSGAFDVSATRKSGVVLVALESATANSGKYIDVYCEQIKYVEPASP